MTHGRCSRITVAWYIAFRPVVVVEMSMGLPQGNVEGERTENMAMRRLCRCRRRRAQRAGQLVIPPLEREVNLGQRCAATLERDAGLERVDCREEFGEDAHELG